VLLDAAQTQVMDRMRTELELTVSRTGLHAGM